ncbi:sel1 repeat family protein [Dyella mobilis]|uniref:Sel1 repeat family protein n=1 Tax=Dyella mobilis TaxID=1849582 RepID=A0ABS2KG36_9GAMM|nr:sel1 repeat family protein [Dyella mobilis]MBM7129889.1 sel1 repeat family protein [Dyella mobilis]GLQ97846.1 hypothetical protein GCM10007863_22660 [Dyella mobilis]
MKVLRAALIFLLVCCVFTSSAWAANGDPSPTLPDKHDLKVLEAMSENSTDWHPDLHGQFEGLIRYEKGDYTEAMQYFLVGARYADKVSQLCIGLLYLNGQGVRRDPVAAYAWVALASERNYPKFVATRDQIGRQLSPQQLAQANELLKKLAANYGDTVAKPRMSAQLMQGTLHMTGSMLGFSPYTQTATPEQYLSGTNSGNLVAGEAPPNCSGGSIEGGVTIGCGEYWSAERWKPSLYFRSMDSLWQSKVTVGALQNVQSPGN